MKLYSRLNQVCQLLLCHKTVHNSYPESLADLKVVVGNHEICTPVEEPLEELIGKDVWSGRIHYRSTGDHYIMWSEGVGGEMDDTWPFQKTPEDDRSKDTVLFDGLSLQWNEGYTHVGCEPFENYYEEVRRVFGELIPALKERR